MEMIFGHTQEWLNGEWTEGIIVTIFGLLTIVTVIALWLTATSHAGRSLVLPLLLCGLVYTGTGVSMLMTNRGRAEEYRNKYEKNPVEFVQQEKQRVEDFQYMYVISKVVATVFFIATILIFWLTKSPVWQGWGIGMTFFGLVGLLVDYFSQHRALEYYDYLTKALMP
ncbi:hypothetical protein [Prevotella histicola]